MRYEKPEKQLISEEKIEPEILDCVSIIHRLQAKIFLTIESAKFTGLIDIKLNDYFLTTNPDLILCCSFTSSIYLLSFSPTGFILFSKSQLSEILSTL